MYTLPRKGGHINLRMMAPKSGGVLFSYTSA
jgi:hypothetical protein